MKTAEELRQLLYKIDHKGYPAYKETKGEYRFEDYSISIDHVQGDPFASPSKLSVKVPGKAAGFPRELYDKPYKRIALQDHLIRNFYRQIAPFSFQAHGSGKSGMISVTKCGQEILERTACTMDEKNGDITVRFEVGFPANGRTINARELMKMLFDFLPSCVNNALYYRNLDQKRVQKVMELSVDQNYIRTHLEEMGLVAFVADGSILPRESGVSSRPMKGAIAFESPETLRVTMELPYRGTITGMGIKKGVTLIGGGGYHGKSTLLKALESSVYPHISGDGREYVVTEPTAMKIRAEDGRCIHHTDISMFISDLPNGKDTKAFDTEDASGSTSQAANMIEGMEAGTKTFLIDEDTSATNFMVRDELMQRVIHRDKEPITPFIERVRELYKTFGISTILVAGSSGAFFKMSDTIIQMDGYHPVDITEKAHEIAEKYPDIRMPEKKAPSPSFERIIKPDKSMHTRDRIKLKTLGTDGFSVGHEMVDLRLVEQLIDTEQLTTLSYMLCYLEKHVFDGKRTLQQAVKLMLSDMEQKGISQIIEGRYLPGNLAMPRKQEVYACMNRYRKLYIC